MSGFFVLFFLLSLVGIVVGLISPTKVLPIRSPSRGKAAGIYAGLSLLFFILIGLTAQPVTKTTQSPKITPTQKQEINTPTNTLTPSPTVSKGKSVIVARVIDGDTIKLETGETVRYIGIDTPETVSPNQPVQCYGKEASAKNKELVEGKTVELEKDVSETDKYGRLLRYVWVGNTLINEFLVREGYAQVSTYPPDIKYQDRFIEAQRLAREDQNGLWGSVCNVTSTPTATPKPTIPSTSTTTNQQTQTNTGGYTCDCSKTCTQISSCEEAQYQLNTCGCKARDADGDGIACDGKPLHCQN